MTLMWRRVFSSVDWYRQAPRIAVVAIGGLMAADLVHMAAGLRTASVVPAAGSVHPSRPAYVVAIAASRISHAHLFGSDKEPAKHLGPGIAPDTRLALALSGTMATPDPSGGYAILGETGKPAHLYRTGVTLGDGLSGRLYQTFTDHVILELDGHLETLKLPRQPTASPNGAPVTAQNATLASVSVDPNPASDPATPNATEHWFEFLHPQHQFSGGIKLLPDKRIQRQYDLRYNDVLTAVNCVDITGPNSFQDLKDTLKTAGKTVQITVIRNGVAQVLTVPITDTL
jgi:type II secretory pathway component PulC